MCLPNSPSIDLNLRLSSWFVAVVIDLVSVSLYATSLVRRHDSRWYNIMMITLMSLAAVAAALNSWYWWRVHKLQTRASLPFMAPAPPVPAR
ncbi:hypothetical protein B0H19DRAFT_1260188 [Mycena capillaripes]|nr:hypothetical protein B0H19DRAFT_1260188 [Mycena capillaripes]